MWFRRCGNGSNDDRTSVGPEDPWPSQPETTLGTSVYSMAFSGYGPTHNLVLWADAVAMKPATIIEALDVAQCI